MKKLFTIKEVADVVQISKRTLHYYHDIELVIPNHIESNGYRLYDSANIRKLQSIIFLKVFESIKLFVVEFVKQEFVMNLIIEIIVKNYN